MGTQTPAPAPALKLLDRYVGSWITEATHPALPGTSVRGTANFEWLDGEQFLVFRAANDHPDFPNSISIIGFTGHGRADAKGHVAREASETLTMHYYDSRGVSREYAAAVDQVSLRFERPDPGFSQRFNGTLTDGGNTLVGQWQVCEDGTHWKDDVAITFRRAPS
jgi:hypothetical protein